MQNVVLLSLPRHRERYIPVFHLIFYKYGLIYENCYSLVIFSLQQKTNKKANLCQVSLKSGQATGDSKGAKFAMSGVNIH